MYLDMIWLVWAALLVGALWAAFAWGKFIGVTRYKQHQDRIRRLNRKGWDDRSQYNRRNRKEGA